MLSVFKRSLLFHMIYYISESFKIVSKTKPFQNIGSGIYLHVDDIQYYYHEIHLIILHPLHDLISRTTVLSHLDFCASFWICFIFCIQPNP